MTLNLLPLIALVIANVLLDLWLYRHLRRSKRWPLLKCGAHVLLSIALLLVLLAATSIPYHDCDNIKFRTGMWLFYIYYAFYFFI